VKNEERRGISTAIYTYADLKRNKKQQTITRKLITEFDTTLPTSPGLFSMGEAYLFLFESSKVHCCNVKLLQD
jgi:hypothetical protein